MKKYTDAQLMRWDATVTKYDEVLKRNLETKVSGMTPIDCERFAKLHNVASSAPCDILKYMVTWGGFHELIGAGFLTNKKSDLFNRLLDGGEPLDFPPPRTYGKLWYDLIDYPEDFYECKVAFSGNGRRIRDEGHEVYLFLVNDCLWSCEMWTLSARALIELNIEWSESTNRSVLWQKACDMIRREDILFHVAFGQWEIDFHLMLMVPDANVTMDCDIEKYDDLFSAIGAAPAFQWVLKNTGEKSMQPASAGQ